MAGDKKVYTVAEVSTHNDRKDCWHVIDGKAQQIKNGANVADELYKADSQPVYDVTKFLEDHPGGDEVLLAATGKDASNDFEDVGHSSTARAMMDEFYVGDIDSISIPAKRMYTPPKQPHYNQDKTTDFVIKLLRFLAPLLILGLAFGVRFYTKASTT